MNNIELQRNYVYSKLDEARKRNPSITKSQVGKVMKAAWREAKRKFK